MTAFYNRAGDVCARAKKIKRNVNPSPACMNHREKYVFPPEKYVNQGEKYIFPSLIYVFLPKKYIFLSMKHINQRENQVGLRPF